MELYDFHVHSNFSDGNNSAEEIIVNAINLGLTRIGISDHSYTHFDESYCIKKSDIDNYVRSINTLKKKYKDNIDVYLGIEQDYYSEESTKQYDYVIGSVHYIKIGKEYIPVDETADILTQAADNYFDGDIYQLIDEYYKTVADVYNKTHCNIIGHFDLIAKFNEDSKIFDENDEKYIASFKKAADVLLKSDVMFEINTGAISRGYRSSPYPSMQIYSYLKDNGAKFILSSDCHDKENLCYSFDKYSNLI